MAGTEWICTCTTTASLLEFEIIGLISEIIKVDPAEFHDFAAVEAMGEMFKDEARADWNQWLIIKTEGE
jgi:hypothetical protein